MCKRSACSAAHSEAKRLSGPHASLKTDPSSLPSRPGFFLCWRCTARLFACSVVAPLPGCGAGHLQGTGVKCAIAVQLANTVEGRGELPFGNSNTFDGDIARFWTLPCWPKNARFAALSAKWATDSTICTLLSRHDPKNACLPTSCPETCPVKMSLPRLHYFQLPHDDPPPILGSAKPIRNLGLGAPQGFRECLLLAWAL